MVSSLSARLLGIPQYKQSTQRSDGTTSNDGSATSGYSADESSSDGQPPVLISVTNSKRQRESSTLERAKRRKLDERNFDASTVAADLARAGRPYPQIMTTRSRIVPNLDLSGVQLVSSKSLQSSPFLHSTTVGWSCNQYDIMTDLGATYQNLISESAPLYESSHAMPRRKVESKTTSDNDSPPLIGTGSFSLPRRTFQVAEQQQQIEKPGDSNDSFLPLQVTA